MKFRAFLSLVLIALVFSGYGPTQSATFVTQSPHQKMPGMPIYGKLKKTDAGYRFVSFSLGLYHNQEKRREASWVRLNALLPCWETSVERSCYKGYLVGKKVGIGKSRCRSDGDELFRYFHPNLAGNIFNSTLTLGLEATSPVGKVTFDPDKFQKAANEAKRALWASLKSEGKSFEHFSRILNDAMSEITRSQDSYRRLYENALTQSKPDITIVDSSGFFRNNFDFSQFIRVTPNTLPDGRGRNTGYPAPPAQIRT